MFTLSAKLRKIKPRISPSPLIILVRHGEAEHLVSNLTGGWTDTSLTENGRLQAKAVAEWLHEELHGKKLNLYCSDLKRAKETAEPIAEVLGLSPGYYIELREKNNGKAAGLTVEEAEKYFTEPPSNKFPLDWLPYEGGETWRQFYARVCGFMDELFPSINDTSIIVSHGGTIHMMVSWWLKLSPESMNDVFFNVETTGVTVLHKPPTGEHLIDRLNDTSHLAKHKVGAPFPLYET